MAEGLRSSVGIAATPFTKGPYTWDQQLKFGGTAKATAVQDSTNGTRLFGVYLNSSATGGDQRAAYFRLWSTGNGTSVSGEAARIYHTVTGVCGAVQGAHISVSFDTNGYTNNEAIACRATVEAPNNSITTGEYAALQAEFYTNGSTARYAGSSVAAFIRCIAAGSEATAPANLDTDLFLFDFSNKSGTNGLTAGSGKFIDTAKTTGTHSGGIRIRLPDGSTAWLAVISA